MDYEKYVKYDESVKLYRLVFDECVGLSAGESADVLSYMNAANEKLLKQRKENLDAQVSNFIRNVSTADVVLAKNMNRKFNKSNVCLRLTNILIQDYKKFAGQLDVPVQDFMVYVLEFGLAYYRVVKEI